jgi:hypothetical protein
MNTLRELISEIYLEVSQKVSDDTVLDDRLLIQFINKQRNLWIRNELNKNRTVDTNIIQDVVLEIEECSQSELDNTPVGYLLYKTKTTIPSFVELHHKPALEQVTPVYTSSVYEQYKVKPFKLIDYTNSMFAGHGKFTRGMVFTYPANDKIYILIPEEGFFNTFASIKVRGVFENPTQVPGFNIETSRYPMSAYMWNYIKGIIIQEDLRNYYIATHDISNNASNDLNRVSGNGEEKES